MNIRPTYKVIATRSGRWWAIESPDVPGALSQSRRLDQAESMISEAISLMLDVPADSFDLKLTYAGINDVVDLAEKVHQARLAVEAAQADTDAAIHDLMAAATDADLSVRDIGKILKVSHQRAHQMLVKASGPGNSSAAAQNSKVGTHAAGRVQKVRHTVPKVAASALR